MDIIKFLRREKELLLQKLEIADTNIMTFKSQGQRLERELQELRYEKIIVSSIKQSKRKPNILELLMSLPARRGALMTPCPQSMFSCSKVSEQYLK